MSRPVAVLIGDLHFTPNTLDLASTSLRMAQQRAIDLNVPLIIAGDTLDSKAIMRAECVNELIEIFTPIPQPETYILVGNHDLLNEKGSEHSLKFLKPYVRVIDKPTWLFGFPALIPYQTDVTVLKKILEETKRRGVTSIICHQGVQTAYMGHYVQDKTSLPPEAFRDFRVISGHYHRRQNIVCGTPSVSNRFTGMFSYIGNPYTQNFGEASDLRKGFKILHDNGSLEFVGTNLRKHVVVEITSTKGGFIPEGISPNDLIWIKVKGSKSELDNVNKKELGEKLFGHDNYKLELIYDEANQIQEDTIKDLSEAEIFDTVIDSLQDSSDLKAYMKTLWRDTYESS